MTIILDPDGFPLLKVSNPVPAPVPVTPLRQVQDVASRRRAISPRS